MIDEKKSGREDLHRLSLLDATLKRRIRKKAFFFLFSYGGFGPPQHGPEL